MSEDQKIWFIYLTDHHEGPFTAAEVAEKLGAGVVTGASLAWKDGMAEWVALETIPELAAVMGQSAAPALADVAAEPFLGDAPAAEGEISLAQMLAASQQGSEASPAAELSLGTKTSTSRTGTATASAPIAARPMITPGTEPDDADEVWSLLIGKEVHGLFSMDQLKAKTKAGEVSEKAMLWHPGWDDYRPLAEFPILAQLRKNAPKKSGGAGIGTSSLKQKGGIVAAPHIDQDSEATDAGIQAPSKFGGIVDKLKGLFAKKPKQALSVNTVATKTGTTGLKKKGGGSGLKKIAIAIVAILVVGGGGAGAYFFLFASPIPSSLDVKPEDLDGMRETLKAPISQGGKLYWAKQTGGEDNPLDETSPIYYVSTNLPVGSTIKLTMKGTPGTLINALRSEATFTENISKQRFATFDKIKQENGKPLPMGEYTVTVTADGAEKFEKKLFFGGKKGPGYENRLHQYIDKLQKNYDEELGFLREELNTMKTMQADISKKLAEYKTAMEKPNGKARVAADWRQYSASLQQLLPQLDQHTKEHLAAPGDRYFPSLFTDLTMAINQMQQLGAAINGKVNGAPIPGSSPDELDGLVLATLMSLEKSISQAVTKTPMEVLQQGAATPSTGAAPAAAAPAQPVAPQNAIKAP